MNYAIVRKIQFLVLGAIVFSSSAMLAQRNKQAQPQAQPQQSAQPAQQQSAAQPQAQSAAPSLCANVPLCYEANDFVATVTQFRVSNDPRGIKIIDAMMHFQNKTNQAISLGYVDGSGSAIDDLGNRLGLNTYNGGVRGMGVVAGNNMDPKFTLPGGGGGDARFEMYWVPGGKLTGVNYEMELSVREMTRVEGNQWTLGDETLIHYQGLANGQGVAATAVPASSVSGGANGMMATGANGMAGTPVSTMGTVNNYAGQASGAQSGMPQQVVAYAAAGQPCPAGTVAAASGPSTGAQVQNAANSAGAQNQNANNAISNASSAISSLSSIFGKKKQPPAAANNATASTPCVAVANTANGASPNPMTAPTANAAVKTTSATTTTTPVNARVVTTAPANARVVMAPAVTNAKTTVATKPSPVVTNASIRQPVPVAKPAVKPATATPPKKPAATTTTTNAAGQ